MAYKRYVPIQIEAKQENGEWWVRNELVFENSEVIGEKKTREWLIAFANTIMIRWIVNYGQVKSLRVSGITTRKGM